MLYDMCGLRVSMTPKHDYLKLRAEKFLAEDQQKKADISLEISDNEFEEYKTKYKCSDDDLAEYALTGIKLFEAISAFDGFVLHSSAVAVDEEAYIFAGTSGTGKSTHSVLWVEMFQERAQYINDDKPIIKIDGDGVVCCGNPFSGKNDYNTPLNVPVKAVYLLEKAKKNSVEPMSRREALALVMSQSYSANDHSNVLKHLGLVEKVVTSVPFFRLKCNISPEAVFVAYHAV